jgi:hypothetical protein
MSNRFCQPSYTRFIVLAETIMGTTVAIEFIGKYSSRFLSTDTCVSHPVRLYRPLIDGCYLTPYPKSVGCWVWLSCSARHARG